MSSLDYLDLCRLCLVKDRVSVPIFEGEGDVRQIFLKIAACLPVKVGREDKLPKKICDDCVYKVELFYQFWNTTANAEKQLLQWLGEVSMDDKQGYVTGAHDPSMMKPGQNTGENRLDGSSVMQQVNEHTNNMGMGMMDGMGIGMPMMIPNSGQQPQQQQMTSVPMDTGGNAVQNVQPVPGPSAQIGQQKINAPTNEDEDEDESEEEDNSDDECDGDDGLPVKEESEDEPNRTIEPTTFVNVSLACDEAGPSGLQQQKIGEMPEMVMPPTDGDPKSGSFERDLLGPTFAKIRVKKDVFQRPMVHAAMLRAPKTEDAQIFDVSRRRTEVNSRAKQNKSTKNTTEKKAIQQPAIAPRSKLVSSTKKKTTKSNGKIENKEEQAEKPDSAKPKERNVGTKIKTEFSTSVEILEDHGDHSDDFRLGNPLENIELDKTDKRKEKVKFECNTCGRTFVIKSRYMAHVIKHSVVKAFVCDLCNKTFKRKCALKAHRRLHKGIRYICDYCKASKSSKMAVRCHIRRVHLREHPFTCEQCGKRFMTNCDLKDHITLHLGVKSFICESCGKGFMRQSALGHHNRRVHGIIKKVLTKIHKCKTCDKSCSSEYALRVHVETHTRKYYCAECDKEFVNNTSLQLHNRKHTGERPFQCDQCPKSFTRSSAFVVHKLTHTGARPFVCDICGKSYTQRTTMMSHRKKHPGNHPRPPPISLLKLVKDTRQ
ncbi:zinc finger protein 69 homolog B-like isoform X10 [Venturia canescens]|uniref:zinc finger protein 69 homolog B-like isoform X10 n=1 Tax=Venturia canescens TaxID=32260 RepID=UPI001C9C192E|nr:zinc finger protein 69 homolog B-like isoform X10 [Venturia canescens]